MANNNRKGFFLYHEYANDLSLLTDEEVGRLVRALLEYSSSGTISMKLGREELFVPHFTTNIDRDAEKYDKRCAAAKASVEKRWDNTNEYERIPTYTDDTNKNKNHNTNHNMIQNNNTTPIAEGSKETTAPADDISEMFTTCGITEPSRKVVDRYIAKYGLGSVFKAMRTAAFDRNVTKWAYVAKMLDDGFVEEQRREDNKKFTAKEIKHNYQQHTYTDAENEALFLNLEEVSA